MVTRFLFFTPQLLGSELNREVGVGSLLCIFLNKDWSDKTGAFLVLLNSSYLATWLENWQCLPVVQCGLKRFLLILKIEPGYK